MRTAGVVLAGGRSLRMGRAKAFLDWHGEPLLAHVVAIVSRAIEDGPVVVVAAPGQALPDLPADVRVVSDAREGLGPLQGIGSGLAALTGLADVAFVSSTDAPLLHPAFVQRVLAGIEPGVDIVVPHARGHRQPLAAAYRVELAPLLDELLAQGLAKPGFLYERSRTRQVDDGWLLEDPRVAAFDPALASLENLNEPADYEAARALPAPAIEVDGETVAARSLGDIARALGIDLGTRVVCVNGEPGTRAAAFPLVAGDRLSISAGGG
jgi:molybdopterin-guanine dinucleotide biosynthesis protein A